MGDSALARIVGETVILVLINIGSIFGNILVMLAVHQTPRLRNITNLFIVNLALADLCCALICMPLTVAAMYVGDYDVKWWMCNVYDYVVYILSGVSLYTVTALAINRFYRVVKPARYNVYFSFKRSVIICCVFWVYHTTSVMLARHFFGIGSTFDSKLDICLWVSRGSLTSYIAGSSLFVMGFTVIPGLLITYCYYRTYQRINDHNKTVGPSLNRHTSNQSGPSAHEIKTTRIMLTLVFAFYLCWIPVATIFLVQIFVPIDRFAYFLIRFLAYMSSLVNPFIYAYMSRDFRRAFSTLICFNAGNMEESGTSSLGNQAESLTAKTRPTQSDASLGTHGRFTYKNGGKVVGNELGNSV